jgi:RNA polymerase-binding protein DksA
MSSRLSEEQVSQLKQKLQKRFNELKEEIRQELLNSENERYIQLAGRVHDTGDEAVADLLADINLAIIDQHIKEIQDIEAALMRVADTSYGYCIECDGDIGYERLKAYPTAKRCYECQANYEKSHAQPHHSGL